MTAHPTRAALHSAAVTLLEQHGDDGVTVEMVLSRAHASKGSLYHHYRDFASLLDEASATRYAAAVDGTVAALQSRPPATADELVVVLTRVATCTSSPYDDTVRIGVLATSVRRPSLLPLLEPHQVRLTAAIADLVRDGQACRWIRRDVDAERLALLLQSVAAGRTVAAVDRLMPADWQAGVAEVLRGALSLEAPAEPAVPGARHGNVPEPRT